MDYLIINMVVKLLNIKSSVLRKLLAGILLAIWPVIMMKLTLGNTVAGDMVTYAIPVAAILVYDKKPLLRVVIKEYIVFMIAAFVLGGIANALYYNTVFGYIMKDEGQTLFIVLAAFLIARGLWNTARTVLWQERAVMGKIYEVSLNLDNVMLKVNALYDSGNTLYDPVFGGYVSVLEKDLLLNKGLAAKDLLKYRYHLIPYNSLGSKNGLLEVIEVKELKIQADKEVIVIKNALIGLYSGRLTTGTAYEMLLNSTVFDVKQGGL